MKDDTGSEVVLTVGELAQRLKIGRNAAYALCRESGFPVVRIGSTIRIPVRMLEEWLQQTNGK